jgi:hypothetical protein
MKKPDFKNYKLEIANAKPNSRNHKFEIMEEKTKN